MTQEEARLTGGTHTSDLAPSRRDFARAFVSAGAGARSAWPPVVFAGFLVLVSLGPWSGPLAAVRVVVFAAGFAAVGMTLIAAGRLTMPSRPAMAALALVLSAAVVSLGVLVLAFVGLPIEPATVFVLGVAVALCARVVPSLRPGRDRPAAEGGEGATDTIEVSAAPSRAAVVVCVGLSAMMLFALPGAVHRLALVLYAGAFGWVLWRGAAHTGGTWPWRGSPGSRIGRWTGPAWLLPLLLLALLLVSRLAPFARSPVPLGYDTGLYRAVQAEFAVALPAFPEFAAGSWADVQPPGLFVLSDLLALVGASADAQLWGLLVLTQLVGGIGVWLLAFDVGGRRAANWALALFVLSTAQYMLFYQVYFKQALALAILPYVLWLWRRESWLAVPLGAFLAAAHSMGFLLLGLILLTDAIWLDRIPSRLRDLRQVLTARRYHLGAGASILLLGLACYALAPRALAGYFSPSLPQVLGRFGLGGDASAGSYRIDAEYYSVLVLPLVPFAALTLARGWREPRVRLVVLWAAWAGTFVVLDLIFARRFIGSLDPAVTVLAAASIAQLTAGSLASRIRPLVAVVVLSGVFLLARTIYVHGPAIPVEDLRDLETASSALPSDAYLMAVSGADTPWVYGYGGRDTIAPGLLEHNQWTLSEWTTFWAPAKPGERYALLARYDRPIYVFMRAEQPFPSIAADPQFERISRTLWRYVPRDAFAGHAGRHPHSQWIAPTRTSRSRHDGRAAQCQSSRIGGHHASRGTWSGLCRHHRLGVPRRGGP